MKSRCIFVALCLLVMILGARAGSAQEIQPLEPQWLRQMYAEGWQKVQEGVLQRDTGGGRFETFSYGAEGLQWTIQSYEQQVQFFEDKYEESPTNELLELIAQLRSKVDSLNAELQAGSSAEPFDGGVLEGCSLSYDATAYAGPQESPQGVTATASAYLHNDCGYVGNTTAYVYAQAIDGTLETYLTKTDPKNNGTWLDSYASAGANGSTACESRAQATVDIPQLGIYYAAPPAENYSCPDTVVPPVTASVSGPTSVTTDYYISSGCADVTWTASATGGHPGGYTYSWYIGADPTVQGTGSTFTKSYCNTSQSVTVKVIASDSDGHTDDETFTTTIQPIGPVVASVSGPSTVTTDYYTSGGCANVTWTASATGGHPGYTYSWYLGTSTGTTVQATGPTFTKSLCSANQSVTVKVVDSDGHNSNKTFTTSVQYRAAIVATISGPTSVSSSTSCTTVSWTASASGTGHSGFSYQWYIGTASQTTGTTFSKQFCSSGGTSQSVTVKVTATASDGHQGTGTHTTTISFPPPPSPTASITGPSELFITTAGGCKSITWTGSATGGTPGYTYSWYIGTSTTVQGTASTLTKSFCGAQTINVKLTVRDAAAQSANATYTTAIYYEPIENCTSGGVRVICQ